MPYLFRNPGDAGPAILHQPREQAPRTDSRKGIVTTESSSRRVKTGGHDAEGVTLINFGRSILGCIINEERQYSDRFPAPRDVAVRAFPTLNVLYFSNPSLPISGKSAKNVFLLVVNAQSMADPSGLTSTSTTTFYHELLAINQISITIIQRILLLSYYYYLV